MLRLEIAIRDADRFCHENTLSLLLLMTFIEDHWKVKITPFVLPTPGTRGRQ